MAAALSPWAQRAFLAVVPVACLPKQAANVDAECPRLPLALLPCSCGDRDEVCGLPAGWRALGMHFIGPSSLSKALNPLEQGGGSWKVGAPTLGRQRSQSQPRLQPGPSDLEVGDGAGGSSHAWQEDTKGE